jgi:hypothetical protein
MVGYVPHQTIVHVHTILMERRFIMAPFVNSVTYHPPFNLFICHTNLGVLICLTQ